MGDDVPLPVLAGTPHMLYDYFKQRFAQVSTSKCFCSLASQMLQPECGCFHSASKTCQLSSR